MRPDKDELCVFCEKRPATIVRMDYDMAAICGACDKDIEAEEARIKSRSQFRQG